jgi:trehalose-6-phosphatase
MPKQRKGIKNPRIFLEFSRLLIFYTDGAIIPFAPAPFLARPSRRVLNVLGKLAEDENNIVYVISGRGIGKFLENSNHRSTNIDKLVQGIAKCKFGSRTWIFLFT